MGQSASAAAQDLAWSNWTLPVPLNVPAHPTVCPWFQTLLPYRFSVQACVGEVDADFCGEPAYADVGDLLDIYVAKGLHGLHSRRARTVRGCGAGADGFAFAGLYARVHDHPAPLTANIWVTLKLCHS